MKSLDQLSNAQLSKAYLKGSECMTLEGVWEVLGHGQWESAWKLAWTTGVDDTTLGLIISFLDRWKFAETRRAPYLQVRRKPGTISPADVFSLLRLIANQSLLPWRLRLAERVACRACGERNFTFLGENQVECAKCHEKQWFAIEINKERTLSKWKILTLWADKVFQSLFPNRRSY